jgi:3-hydroxyacyl-[acyl-carrier-protein] dehydratase
VARPESPKGVAENLTTPFAKPQGVPPLEFSRKLDPMRFWLLDRIRTFEPDKELSAEKNVTMSEEYLADHFPEFPVLPGVFMLEAATQAGAWLLRLSENFAHSIISLKEARNVKYADFVAPGRSLEVTVSMLKKDDRLATMKVEGRVGDRQTLSGRIVLERYNLADRDPVQRDTDQRIIQHFRRTQKLLIPKSLAAAAG